MRIVKYNIHSQALRKVAEFIWHIKSDVNITRGRLLPVVNTDLLINISTPIFYTFVNGKKIKAPPLHIRNIMLQPQFIDQEAVCDVWGVSLYPYGTYALFNGNMNIYREQIIDLQKSSPLLSAELAENTDGNMKESQVANEIEMVLAENSVAPLPEDNFRAIIQFLSKMLHHRIGEYCTKNNMSIKKLERLFKKYTGLTPKQIQWISRFQKSRNDMLYPDKAPAIADIAYLHEYTDQMHLTKTFREYAGVSPFQFLYNHNSIKEKLNRKDR